MSAIAYSMLDGPWPVLQKANTVSPSVIDIIKTIGNGTAITTNLGYFSLGRFYIETSLLTPHITQRPLNTMHADTLKQNFQQSGPMRTEYHGVVIGLGDGWYNMKNPGPRPYMISSSCPHLDLLRKSSGGPIAEIIRGNHRTEAIRRYSSQTEPSPSQAQSPLQHENYWFYEVLVPCTFIQHSSFPSSHFI
jgi:hypothetical protein